MLSSLRLLTPSCLMFVLIFIAVKGNEDSGISPNGTPDWKHSLRVLQRSYSKEIRKRTEDLQNEGHYENEITVTEPAIWKKIFYFDNGGDGQVTKSTKWTKGFRKLHREEHTIKTTHSFGMTTKIGAGVPFKVFKASLSLETSYNFNLENQKQVMTESEVYSSEEHTTELTVPPKTVLVVWQLTVDVGGEEMGFQFFVSSNNKSYSPPNELSLIQVKKRRQIHPSTPFRLKHARTGLFVIIVARKGWPAADLSRNPDYYFHYTYGFYSNYYCCNNYRIYTKNTTDPGYSAMYSSTAGGIYFDQTADNPKQFWKFGKPMPLYFGDRVTLRNVYYQAAGLCYHQGPITTVYCLDNKEDEWILY